MKIAYEHHVPDIDSQRLKHYPESEMFFSERNRQLTREELVPVVRSMP